MSNSNEEYSTDGAIRLLTMGIKCDADFMQKNKRTTCSFFFSYFSSDSSLWQYLKVLLTQAIPEIHGQWQKWRIFAVIWTRLVKN